MEVKEIVLDTRYLLEKIKGDKIVTQAIVAKR